jgi:ArsR family transcriptional regulator
MRADTEPEAELERPGAPDPRPLERTNAHAHDLTVLDDPARDAAAATLRLLGDGTRLTLLWQLRAGELAVGDLARRVRRPSPAVSQHLAKLRLAGLVTTRREGTTIYYRLGTEHVRRLVEDVVAHAQHLEAAR